jgi:polar amino acid transport system substrate-binding protein
MSMRGRAALIIAGALLVSACTSSSSPSPSSAPSAAPPSAAPPSAAPEASASPAPATPIPGGLLDKVLKAGVLVVSTDPNSAPESFQNPDGTYVGFDISVATELAKRLGVTVKFVTPDWAIITAGSWSGRWDVSVGSMTPTSTRAKVLDFSPPYYFVPAQLTASAASGITTIDGMAGKSVCTGEATTHVDWLNGTKLDFGALSPTNSPPPGIKVVTLKTDAECPQTWKAGRNDFQGWLGSLSTVEAAIKAGDPVVTLGAPVYFEPSSIAVDKSGPNDTDFVARLTQIVNDMHTDGTLAALSLKYEGNDLTKGP